MEENKNGIEFLDLNPRGGKARIDCSDIEFTIENCNAYFGVYEGKPYVYCLEEDMPGTYVPCLKIEIDMNPSSFNGTGSRITKALYALHDEYRKQINEQKDKELKSKGV